MILYTHILVMHNHDFSVPLRQAKGFSQLSLPVSKASKRRKNSRWSRRGFSLWEWNWRNWDHNKEIINHNEPHIFGLLRTYGIFMVNLGMVSTALLALLEYRLENSSIFWCKITKGYYPLVISYSLPWNIKTMKIDELLFLNTAIFNPELLDYPRVHWKNWEMYNIGHLINMFTPWGANWEIADLTKTLWYFWEIRGLREYFLRKLINCIGYRANMRIFYLPQWYRQTKQHAILIKGNRDPNQQDVNISSTIVWPPNQQMFRQPSFGNQFWSIPTSSWGSANLAFPFRFGFGNGPICTLKTETEGNWRLDTEASTDDTDWGGIPSLFHFPSSNQTLAGKSTN